MVMLFGLPAASWYYLQSGYDYRKEALDDLAPKFSFSDSDVSLWFGAKEISRELIGKTTCISFSENAVFDSTYVDQYKNSYSFQFMKDDALKIRGVAVGDYYLVDTSGAIRYIYTDERSDLTKLIEHTAIILPRQKQKDINLKKVSNGN